MDHLPIVDLEAGLDLVRAAPADHGTVEMIVSRPEEDERRVLSEGRFTLEDGLVGDNWRSRTGADGAPMLEAQVTVMNSRYVDLIAGDRKRWSLAGDQLYVDLDLSIDNVPPGTRLKVGSAVIEVSPQPHTGCDKFKERFGQDALRLVSSPLGRGLRLRGLNARVIEAGTVHPGDAVVKL
jgi:hypothetical protein